MGVDFVRVDLVGLTPSGLDVREAIHPSSPRIFNFHTIEYHSSVKDVGILHL